MKLAPVGAEVRDLLAICEGGNLPLVLRANGENFEFIGESYVHGITDGALRENLETLKQFHYTATEIKSATGADVGVLATGEGYIDLQDFWIV